MPTHTRRPLDPQKLLDLRKRAGLSQSQLAARCTEMGWPITQPAIAKLEGGKSERPWIETLDALAAALAEALDETVTRDDLLVEAVAA
jgi:transcriptional regulator with XRE-family HTH domain